MLEVRQGLLLGSMGDALAVFTRVPSVWAQHEVTHVLSLCNEKPEWIDQLAPETEGREEGEEEAEGGEIKEQEEEEEEEEGRDGPVVGAGEQAEDNSEEMMKGKGRRGRRRRRRRKVELPRRRMFIQVLDMPKSDLLHKFEACCQFIKEGREKGAVLVHCEHGVSRSVAVVLAYLMWSECLSLKLLYQELKERKPDIRPNSGFMDQLRLWGEMGCQIKEENKRYRGYRLQCRAQEMERSGYIESMALSPDPAVTPVTAAVYCRCRKCRQLLFTDKNVLQHELGEGREAFGRHRRRGGQAVKSHASQQMGTVQGDQKMEEEGKQGEGGVSPPAQKESEVEGEREGRGGGEGVLPEGLPTSVGQIEDHEGASRLTQAKEKEEEVVSEPAVLGGNPELNISLPDPPPERQTPPSPLPEPLSPSEVSKVREEVASMVALGRQQVLTLPACSSFFIEPVEWMGSQLLGHMEGKILCPKCNSRLGSFSWKGQQCSCGRWVTPAFQVHKNRIDEVRTLTRRSKPV